MFRDSRRPALEFARTPRGPWVDELRSSWKYARDQAARAGAAAGVKEVTSIDPDVKGSSPRCEARALKFITTGVAYRHLLATLDNLEKLVGARNGAQGEDK